MRVTSSSVAGNLVYNLQQVTKRIDTLQTQLASGKQVQTVSDDPNQARSGMKLRTSLTANEQYQKNANDAEGWIQSTDMALDQLGRVLERAKVLAVNGGMDTLPVESRQALADEAKQLLGEAVQVGNATYGDKYIFAGFKTKSPAFTLTGLTVTPNNPSDGSEILNREISAGVRLSINVTGQALTDTKVFDALSNLANSLSSGQALETGTTRLQEIDDSINAILSLRSEIGAKANRVSAAKDALTGAEVNINKLLESAEDVDVTKAIVDLTVAETSRQTALAVGARIIPKTLVDFLR